MPSVEILFKLPIGIRNERASTGDHRDCVVLLCHQDSVPKIERNSCSLLSLMYQIQLDVLVKMSKSEQNIARDEEHEKQEAFSMLVVCLWLHADSMLGRRRLSIRSPMEGRVVAWWLCWK